MKGSNVNLNGKINVTITRKNGKVIHIGCLKGGHWYERIIPHIRLWIANWQVRRGGK
jgi:hypothetical protein